MTDGWGVASTLIAAGGLAFTGWNLGLIHRDRKKERELEIEGVCLSWQAKEAPNQADVDADGNAPWTYMFRLDNPGRFPISKIEARVIFPSPVTRLRHNNVMDQSDPVLALAHPVLAGGASYEWPLRRLRMIYDPSLNHLGIQAQVSFLDSEGKEHSTTWPMVSDRN